MTGRESGY